MSFFGKIFNFFKPKRAMPVVDIEEKSDSHSLDAGFRPLFGPSGDTNYRNWMDQFIHNSNLRTPTHRVAEDVSMVRWHLFESSHDGMRRRVRNELSDWWNMPSPGELGIYFRYCTVVNLDLTGNAFWWFPNPADIKAGAVVFTRQQLVSMPKSDKPFWEFSHAGVTRRYDVAEIVWLKRPDPRNPLGLGSGFGDCLGSDLQQLDSMSRFNNQFFRQGAHLGSVFGIENASEEAWDRFEESFRQENTGVQNAFKSHFVSGKVTGLQIGAKHRDLDFVEGYDQKRASVRHTIGTPGEILGDNKNSNRANTFEASNLHQTYGLFPRLEHLQLVLNQIVLPKFGYSNFEFEFENPIRQKEELLADKFESGIVRGAVSIDEYRRHLGLDHMVNGDRVMIPLNTMPARPEDFDKIRDAQLSQRQNLAQNNPSSLPSSNGKSIVDKYLEGMNAG